MLTIYVDWTRSNPLLFSVDLRSITQPSTSITRITKSQSISKSLRLEKSQPSRARMDFACSREPLSRAMVSQKFRPCSVTIEFRYRVTGNDENYIFKTVIPVLISLCRECFPDPLLSFSYPVLWKTTDALLQSLL